MEFRQVMNFFFDFCFRLYIYMYRGRKCSELLRFNFQECVKQWWTLCKEKGIPVSDNFSLFSTLGDPLSTRAWNIAGLPVDR